MYNKDMEVMTLEQSSFKEIMKALSMHSEKIQKDIRGMEKRLEEKMDMKIDNLEKKMNTKIANLEEKMNTNINHLEDKMDHRFDRLDAKFSGLRVELTESQESIHYLTSKSLQHDQKLRKIHEQSS